MLLAGIQGGQHVLLDAADRGAGPRLGRIRLPGHPVHYSRSAVAPGLPPPVLGGHTEELRAALLRPVRTDGG